jgi:hypothetical protein
MVLYVRLRGKALYQFVLPQHGVDLAFPTLSNHCQSSVHTRIGHELSMACVCVCIKILADFIMISYNCEPENAS